jgi:hypothetical protein
MMRESLEDGNSLEDRKRFHLREKNPDFAETELRDLQDVSSLRKCKTARGDVNEPV